MYWVLRGCDGGRGDDLDLQREDATIELAAVCWLWLWLWLGVR